MSMSWLCRWPALKMESEVHSLGERHSNYGVSLSSLVSFLIWLSEVIQSELSLSPEDSAGTSWVILWVRFFTIPMMDGFMHASGINKLDSIRSAISDLEVLGQTDFADHFFDDLQLSVPRILRLFPTASLRQHKQVVFDFIGNLLKDLAQRDGDSCKKKIKTIASLHARQRVSVLDILYFVQVFLKAMRSKLKDLGVDEKQQTQQQDRWAHVLLANFVDAHIFSSFEHAADRISDVTCVLETKTEFGYEDWLALGLSQGIAEEILETSFNQIQMAMGSPVSPGRLLRVLQNECLRNPGMDFERLAIKISKPKLG